MSSPIIVEDLLRGSLRLIGAIATGEPLDADNSSDALQTLNDLLEARSLENLAVWGSAVLPFNTVANQAAYTIGPGGNWNTARPIRIRGGYCTVGGVDYEIRDWGQTEYDLVSLKSQKGDIVERFLYVNDHPLGIITLWPVPTSVIVVTLDIDRVLTFPVTLATVLVMPPGYTRYFKYATAVEAAPEYQTEAPATVKAVAVSALAGIKRANKVKVLSRYDPVFVDEGPTTYQRGY